jgi:prepilin-type N-terminal cleavage/methylation domain-containing protein
MNWRASHCCSRARAHRAGFTLLEVLLSVTLVGLMLVALNSFVFSMGELWGQRTDVRLFDQHVRAVTRFLERELRTAAFPPAARPNSKPIAVEEVKTANGGPEKLITFDLPGGSRFFSLPGRPLPEVVCSIQAKPREGLVLLWRSRLEKNFDTDNPREAVVTPLLTGMTYDYWDENTRRWTTETQLQNDPQGQPMAPQRLRLQFAYNQLTRETVVIVPTVGQGMPAF